MTYFGRPITSGTAATWDGDSFVFDSTPGSGGGSITAFGSSNAIYMAINGNDATGQRGNPSRPFLTLQAATNAASDGDTIYIGPGVFSLNSVAGTAYQLPASLQSISIIGNGIITDVSDSSPWSSPPKAGTLIRDLTRTGILINASRISAGTEVMGFRLENLSLHAPNVTTFISGTDVNGTSGNYMNGDGLVLRNISLYSPQSNVQALHLTKANNYTIENVYFRQNDVILFHCCENVNTPTRNLRTRVLYLNTDTSVSGFPSLGRARQNFHNCQFDIDIYLAGHPDVLFDNNCICNGKLTSETIRPLTVNGSTVPRIRYHGRVGNITFGGGGTELPNTAGVNSIIDFSGAEVSSESAGTFTWGQITLANPFGSTRQRIKADGTIAKTIVLDNAIDYFDRFLDITQISATTQNSSRIAPRSWNGVNDVLGFTTVQCFYRNPPLGPGVLNMFSPPVAIIATPTSSSVTNVSIVSYTGLTFPSSSFIVSGSGGAINGCSFTAFFRDVY